MFSKVEWALKNRWYTWSPSFGSPAPNWGSFLGSDGTAEFLRTLWGRVRKPKGNQKGKGAFQNWQALNFAPKHGGSFLGFFCICLQNDLRSGKAKVCAFKVHYLRQIPKVFLWIYNYQPRSTKLWLEMPRTLQKFAVDLGYLKSARCMVVIDAMAFVPWYQGLNFNVMSCLWGQHLKAPQWDFNGLKLLIRPPFFITFDAHPSGSTADFQLMVIQ